MLNDWSNQKKTFRLIKRYSFTSGRTEFPFRIDCSIVKTSKKRKYYIPEYTVEQSEVFNNPENYEIEIELLNDRARFLPKGAYSEFKKCNKNGFIRMATIEFSHIF